MPNILTPPGAFHKHAGRSAEGASSRAMDSAQQMEVRNVRWLGIRTDNYEAIVGFLRDILGLKVNFEEPTTVEFTTSEGDRVQVMAPADPYYDFFGEHAPRVCSQARTKPSSFPSGSAIVNFRVP